MYHSPLRSTTGGRPYPPRRSVGQIPKRSAQTRVPPPWGKLPPWTQTRPDSHRWNSAASVAGGRQVRGRPWTIAIEFLREREPAARTNDADPPAASGCSLGSVVAGPPPRAVLGSTASDGRASSTVDDGCPRTTAAEPRPGPGSSGASDRPAFGVSRGRAALPSAVRYRR